LHVERDPERDARVDGLCQGAQAPERPIARSGSLRGRASASRADQCPFDGFHANPGIGLEDLLVRFDNNKYSVASWLSADRRESRLMPIASPAGFGSS